mmetsp:Transcript_117033/g.364424  ORF Transcript_117033/g.364424 Transcript_117033/m.364424 type:complete len:345 (-) Transcript_117033:213-1247(-)
MTSLRNSSVSALDLRMDLPPRLAIARTSRILAAKRENSSCRVLTCSRSSQTWGLSTSSSWMSSRLKLTFNTAGSWSFPRKRMNCAALASNAAPTRQISSVRAWRLRACCWSCWASLSSSLVRTCCRSCRSFGTAADKGELCRRFGRSHVCVSGADRCAVLSAILVLRNGFFLSLPSLLASEGSSEWKGSEAIRTTPAASCTLPSSPPTLAISCVIRSTVLCSSSLGCGTSTMEELLSLASLEGRLPSSARSIATTWSTCPMSSSSFSWISETSSHHWLIAASRASPASPVSSCRHFTFEARSLPKMRAVLNVRMEAAALRTELRSLSCAVRLCSSICSTLAACR